MSVNITLTSSMRSNLSSLKSLASQMSTTQTRLSTGKKVNSAIDNANSYYQSRALTNRASDLDMLLDSMGQSIQTITTAVKGLEASGEILENAAVIAKEAYEAAIIPEKAWFEAQVGPNGAVVSTAQELKDAVNANKETICVYGHIDMGEITSGLTLNDNQKLVGVGYFGDFDSEIDKFSSISASCTRNIIMLANNTTANNLISDLSINFATTNSSANSCLRNNGTMTIKNVEINQDNPIRSNWSYTVYNLGNLSIEGNVNLKTMGDNQNRGIRNNANMMIKSGAKLTCKTQGFGVLCCSNGVLNIEGKMFNNGWWGCEGGTVNIAASADVLGNAIRGAYESNMVVINYAKGAHVTVGGRSYEVMEDASLINQNIQASNIQSLLNVQRMAEDEQFVYPTAEPRADEKVLAQSAEQYLTAMSAFDEMISDSSYQGVNLLKGGKLTTMFNEDRTHSYTINGKDMSLSGLGITTREWQTKGDIAASIKEIQNAMISIRDEVARLGNNLSIIETRMNFTDGLVDVLQTGADDLVLADMNEESANYLALQTRNSLAVNALALAAQSNNAVLKLF